MATTCSALRFILLSMPLLSLLSLTVALNLNPPTKPNTFTLPIEKDPSALQYSTSIKMGTPPVTLSLVIDIRERFLWFECDDSYNSSTYNPVRCGTRKCKLAKGTGCINCTNHPLKTGCTNNTCGVEPFNPFGGFFVSGDVGKDILSLRNVHVPRFISSCVYPNKFGVQGFLQGLAKGKKGVLGLARTAISLPTQIAAKFNLNRKFALCLPSKKKELGNLFVGGAPRDASSSKLLAFTPLVINRHSTGPIFDDGISTEYFIRVKSIKIDGEVVSFNTSLLSIDKQGNGGTKLSTVIPHTKLHTSIYRPVLSDFVKKAAVRKMKRVAAVAPFEACYDSRTVGKTVAGPDVPTIDLVLKGGVQWRIHGSNSMVKVGKNVLCLGFVDAGSEEGPLETSIVIGGHQLEDNLLEFDLVSSRLGFSSSLLLHNASCSHLRVF